MLDENVEHQVLRRLEAAGFSTEHVDFVADLGKGTGDRSIADYSRSEQLVIVTSDDDFILDRDPTSYRGVVHIPDETLSAGQIAEILLRMADSYPDAAFDGIEYAGREWL